MTSPELNTQAAVVFLRQAASALRHGLPIADVVPILAHDPAFSTTARDALNRLTVALESGTALVSALTTEQLFQPSSLALIDAAPTDDDRASAMAALADDFEHLARGSNVIRIALIWPLFVAVLAALIVAFLTIFVFPVVSDLYGQFGYDLPMVTQLVRAIYPLAGASVLLALLAGWWARIRIRRRGMPHQLDRAFSRITDVLPFLNAHIHAQCTARLARWLLEVHQSPAMVRAAVLHLAATTTSSRLRNALDRLHHALATGIPLSTALGQTGGFPVRVALYAQLGEKLNDFDGAMSQLCTLCDAREVVALRSYESSVIVITYILMAIVVGTLMVAVYSPLLRMGTLI